MKYENYCTADLESTAIPVSGILNIDRIHCVGVKAGTDDTLCYTSSFLPLSNYGGDLNDALAVINSHDYVVGHNFCGFDTPVIENLIGEITAEIIDTLIISKIIYSKDELMEMDANDDDMPTSLYGRFSLEAFGHRLGKHKGDFNDWTTLTAEMCSYCTNDVDVTYELFQVLLDAEHYPNSNTLALEHEVAYLIAQQSFYGFHFNLEAARKLFTKLMHEKLTIEMRLAKLFKPKFLADGKPIIPAGSRRVRKYLPVPSFRDWDAVHYFPRQYKRQKNGKIKLRGKTYFKWFTEPMRTIYSYTEGEYQPIKLKKFEPGSRNKIRRWLLDDFGFTFKTFTEKGTPKVDGDELEALGEHGVDLRRYLKIVKDSSQLLGLIEAVRDDGTVTSRIDTNGTITGRFTSSSVNLAQIPAVEQFRSLFDAPDGWTFVGTDFDGQENINLAEALFDFDNGRLNNIITNGSKSDGSDLHSVNSRNCDVSRDDGKPLWFGFLYGSSSTLTGYTLLGRKDYTDYTDAEYAAADKKIQRRLTEPNEDGEQYYPVKSGQSAVYVLYEPQLIKQAIFGAHIQAKLIKSTDGLSDLIQHLEAIVEKTGGITTLGGRFIPVNSSHKCLNYFCQGQGAESMKLYNKIYHDKLHDLGLVHGVHYIQQACIYDEVDLIVRDDYVDTVAEVLRSTYAEVSKLLGMTCAYTGEVMVGKSWYECH